MKASAVTTGSARSTPGTAATAAASSSGRSPASPETTCSAARPAIVSTTSVKARSTAPLASWIAHTRATPQEMARAERPSPAASPRAKRSDIRSPRAIYHTIVMAAALTPEDGARRSTLVPGTSVPAARASAMASGRLQVLMFP